MKREKRGQVFKHGACWYFCSWVHDVFFSVPRMGEQPSRKTFNQIANVIHGLSELEQDESSRQFNGKQDSWAGSTCMLRGGLLHEFVPFPVKTRGICHSEHQQGFSFLHRHLHLPPTDKPRLRGFVGLRKLCPTRATGVAGEKSSCQRLDCTSATEKSSSWSLGTCPVSPAPRPSNWQTTRLRTKYPPLLVPHKYTIYILI